MIVRPKPPPKAAYRKTGKTTTSRIALQCELADNVTFEEQSATPVNNMAISCANRDNYLGVLAGFAAGWIFVLTICGAKISS